VAEAEHPERRSMRQLRVILDGALERIGLRWRELLEDLLPKVQGGIPVDEANEVCNEGWRRLEHELDQIDVPRVETEADVAEFRRCYLDGVESALRRSTGYVRTELGRWGAATDLHGYPEASGCDL
jgi:hypothetical protein